MKLIYEIMLKPPIPPSYHIYIQIGQYSNSIVFFFSLFFCLFLDGLSGTNWTGGVNFVLVLSFAVQWNGLTAEVSVMSSSFLFEMCKYDFAEKWRSILCALLEAHRIARTWYENGKFANQYGCAVSNTKSQCVEHEAKSTRQTIRITIANAATINTATE